MTTAQRIPAGAPTESIRLRLDVEAIRQDFPILQREVHGRPLVYLDNAATSQKPRSVIEAVSHFYSSINSNVHRGVHQLSQDATAAYEGARRKVQRFVNARDWREIVFVRGATEAINLVASSFGWKNISSGDEIVISTLEHHSNIVPWQLFCERSGAVLRVVPISDEGEFLIDEYESLLGPKTRLVSVTHVSNALGTVIPLKQVIGLARERRIPVLVDGAQAVPHMPVDVRRLDCDFYAFSSHKMFGPSGVGVLYGRAELLELMPPYQGGGDMIASVSFEKTTFNALPYKFEAGTPSIAAAVGLGEAVDYLTRVVGLEKIVDYERELLAYATRALRAVPGLRVIGSAADKASVISFVLDGIHPHDIGTILDQQGIAIRSGHHCAQPVMDRFGVPATARVSLAFYNTRSEIDALVEAIDKVREVFS